jgi:hypothetical protein
MKKLLTELTEQEGRGTPSTRQRADHFWSKLARHRQMDTIKQEPSYTSKYLLITSTARQQQ